MEYKRYKRAGKYYTGIFDISPITGFKRMVGSVRWSSKSGLTVQRLNAKLESLKWKVQPLKKWIAYVKIVYDKEEKRAHAFSFSAAYPTTGEDKKEALDNAGYIWNKFFERLISEGWGFLVNGNYELGVEESNGEDVEVYHNGRRREQLEGWLKKVL